MIVTRIDRLGHLLRRLRVDRRLPPVVTKMATQAVTARLTRRYRGLRAAVLPVVGDGPTSAGVDFWLGRRVGQGALWATDRPSPTVFAEQIQALCQGEGIGCVALESTPTQVRLAIAIEDRQRLWKIVRRYHGSSFLVGSWSGNRPRVISRMRSHYARSFGAPVWLLLRPTARGREVNTRWCRVELAFFEVGSSGQREMVGVRHNARYDEGGTTGVERVGESTLTVFEGRPVNHRIEGIHQPIDVVFTWVDADDPVWRQRMLAARGDASPGQSGSDEVDWERYESRDELRYALRSVADCAPWVSQIWLVTDGQRPSWLADHPRVTVVDHRSIFPDDVLPVFNSHAIEASLHRIPGLAERFIYFNDDFFLGRPLAATAFFASDQVARVFPSDAPVPIVETASTAVVDTAALRGNEVLNDVFGRVARFKLLHTPQPLFRSVLEEIEQSVPKRHAATVASRFRSGEDLSIPSFLAPYWSVETGKGVISSIDNRYINIEHPRLSWVLDPILQFGCDTLCLNQTSTPRTGSSSDDRMRRFLDSMYPVAAPWEIDAN